MSKYKKGKMSAAEKHRRWLQREWYSVRPLFGNDWAMFYFLIGPRENGKSYSIMEYFVKKWKTKHIPFNWLRISQESIDKMLANDAIGFVDAPIARKYQLDLKVKGNYVYDGDELMCRCFAISTMAKLKGVALFDHEFLNDPDMYYHICIDEFNPEKKERRTWGDLVYNLVNTLETMIRSTHNRVKVVFAANLLEEGSEILSRCFGFVPHNYGVYKLKSKRCVIDYIEPNDAYKARREDTAASYLAPNESTFTNQISHDFTNITKQRVKRPLYFIAFDKNTKYTVWDGNIIKFYNGEAVQGHAMRPYLDMPFNKKIVDTISKTYNAQSYYFDSLITQTCFKTEMSNLKPNG